MRSKFHQRWDSWDFWDRSPEPESGNAIPRPCPSGEIGRGGVQGLPVRQDTSRGKRSQIFANNHNPFFRSSDDDKKEIDCNHQATHSRKQGIIKGERLPSECERLHPKTLGAYSRNRTRGIMPSRCDHSFERKQVAGRDRRCRIIHRSARAR